MAVSRPLYERIEKQLRRRLDAAAEGDPFPSETRLAQEFDVSRMTVRAALAGLERDGLLERVPGKGTFVRRPATSRPVGTLLSFHDQALTLGRTPRSSVLEAGLRAATPEEASALGHQRVVAVRRTRFLGEEAVAIEDAAFPDSLSAVLDADIETASLHQALRQLGFEPTAGTSFLTARIAGDDAVHLGVPPETPLLVETRTIVDQHGAPLEHSTSAYVAERYNLKVDFTIVR
ncbi:GntR family transcriptional regulator [Actinomadura rupiterrae]|uniref:GntR family transcriptional regulator n=1 Tax=Actinomadura rupiterrae TaxID=559627 RepID=UPI0020A2C4C3|nr:GntR family transcriptional regulator [Actinomadura rupiterrae]MCP2339420.1 GntR family transcriptional regulator [Actinomadura rupiterrae]